MRRIEISPKTIDAKEFLGRYPTQEEMGDVIDESTVIVVDGKPTIAYMILDEADCAGMRRVARSTRVSKGTRKSGVAKKASVFGAMPRSSTRSDYCRFTRNTHDEPANVQEVKRFGQKLAEVYRELFPEVFDRAMAEIEAVVHEDWRWSGTPFLTCNVNLNHAIKFHLDAGNVRSALSNVFILKRGIDGGELVCPEFGISFSQRDRALVIFDGQKIVHGVRPISPTVGAIESYRASIVYYTMNGMKLCLCKDDELKRARDVRTQKERLTKEESRAKILAATKRSL